MTLQVAAYPQATVRLDARDPVTLPCEHWRRRGSRYQYRDDAGTAGGAELWIGIGGQRLVGRFHSFRRNDADLIVTRKPSAAAAAGEAVGEPEDRSTRIGLTAAQDSPSFA
jgi:hypothetical protein